MKALPVGIGIRNCIWPSCQDAYRISTIHQALRQASPEITTATGNHDPFHATAPQVKIATMAMNTTVKA